RLLRQASDPSSANRAGDGWFSPERRRRRLGGAHPKRAGRPRRSRSRRRYGRRPCFPARRTDSAARGAFPPPRRLKGRRVLRGPLRHLLVRERQAMSPLGGHQAFPGGPCTPAIPPVPAVRPMVAIRPSETYVKDTKRHV